MDVNNKKKSIILPPPNATGKLHLGHAFQQVLMDHIARYQRQQGYEVSWIAGWDHAGIAGQEYIEKKYPEARYEPLKAQEICGESANHILSQMASLTLSLDNDKVLSTIDSTSNKAVNTAFKLLYNDNIIYKGERIGYYDYTFKTFISDAEVENIMVKTKLYYLKYSLVNSQYHNLKIYIATTRPETIWADVALMVNPHDQRYHNLIGQLVYVPLTGRQIPILADEEVDLSFGTGCMKITPAHDQLDYKLGKKHKLASICMLDDQGLITSPAPEKYHGLTPSQSRLLVLEELKNNQLVLDVNGEDNLSLIPHGDRSNQPLETFLTKQWFVKTTKLIKPLFSLIESNQLKIYPATRKNNLIAWLNKINNDWCISRQTWWGHKIPVWYDEYRNIFIGETTEEVYQEYNLATNTMLTQEVGVLDTWFSSSLWPLTLREWPTNDKFITHDYLVTGYDLLFFWIIKMCMMTYHLTKKLPFTNLIITGMIRDSEGNKMSKSKGNVIDPLDIIYGITVEDFNNKSDKESANLKLLANNSQLKPYGVDCLRLLFNSLSLQGDTVKFILSDLNTYQYLLNKLYNANKFVDIYTAGYNYNPDNLKNLKLPVNCWIISELQQGDHKISEARNQFRFNDALELITKFFINSFCSFYIEVLKVIFHQESPENHQESQACLSYTFNYILKWFYPIIPQFVTNLNKDHQITKLTWTKLSDKGFNKFIEIIKTIRSLTKNLKDVKLYLVVNDHNNQEYKYLKVLVSSLTNINNIFWELPKSKYSIKEVVGDIEIYVIYKTELVTKEITNKKSRILHLNKLLTNPEFIDKAPKKVIDSYRQELTILQASLENTNLENQ